MSTHPSFGTAAWLLRLHTTRQYSMLLRIARSLAAIMLGVQIAGATANSSPVIEAPAARSHAAMAALNGKLVLFGGSDEKGKLLADTWEFNGSAWTRVSPAVSPPARRGASMAVAGTSGQKILVLSGGMLEDHEGRLVMAKDGWIWDGSTWTEIAHPLPWPRNQAAMAELDGGSLLHGGMLLVGQRGIVFADTWWWNGKSWSRSTLPEKRTVELDGRHTSIFPAWAHTLTYDPVTGKAIRFGGCNTQGCNSDVLVFTKESFQWVYWHCCNELPAGRGDHAAAYSVPNQAILFFGGRKSDRTVLNDTWLGSLDEGTEAPMYWTRITGNGQKPSGRYGHSMASLNGTVYLFGGRTETDTLGDMWKWDGSKWSPVRQGSK